MPTPRQKEALRIALNTPDIALIQGPPGTGKTKVISALQVRLAEISEDSSSVSGRTLLTSYQHDAVENAADRTVVFGLPAYKVGKRPKQTEESDNVERWCEESKEALKAQLAAMPELPESAVLRRVQALVQGYILAPLNPQQTAELLKNIFELTEGKITGGCSDRLLEFSQTLARGTFHLDDEEPERELNIQAVRALRTNPVAFSDDGSWNARKALRRLHRVQILETAERQLLEKAADWQDESAPPFLEELAALRDRLLERLLPVTTSAITPVANPEIEALLTKVVDTLYQRVRQSREGVDAVIAEYLDDLENDPHGVRKMIRDRKTRRKPLHLCMAVIRWSK